MSFILEILLELLGQFVFELIADVLFGVGDAVTGGRTKRVLLFGATGAGAGAVSLHFRPQLVIADAFVRYATIAGLTLAGGLFLALFESRVRRGGPGAATAGLLCGVAFSLGYVGVRRFFLP